MNFYPYSLYLRNLLIFLISGDKKTALIGAYFALVQGSMGGVSDNEIICSACGGGIMVC